MRLVFILMALLIISCAQKTQFIPNDSKRVRVLYSMPERPFKVLGTITSEGSDPEHQVVEKAKAIGADAIVVVDRIYLHSYQLLEMFSTNIYKIKAKVIRFEKKDSQSPQIG